MKIDRVQTLAALGRLYRYVRTTAWQGYDPFDALASPVLRLASVGLGPGRIAVIQLLKRLPWNLRPLLLVRPHESPFALALFARGCLDAFRATGDESWRWDAEALLERLRHAQTPGYWGACWGYPFAYQNRIFYTPPRTPTAVITSFVGAAFLEAYHALDRAADLMMARSACEFLRRDLRRTEDGPHRLCFSYTPLEADRIHNANALVGALFVRVGRETSEPPLVELGRRALAYTVAHQRGDGSWPYGEGLRRLGWVDNHHTAYVLECLARLLEADDAPDAREALERGLEFYLTRFFGADGAPFYGPGRRRPIDIQCAGVAIDTLALLGRRRRDCLSAARRAAAWTVRHMQAGDGHFHYRRGRLLRSRTPYVHWGQATMLAALARLARVLRDHRKQDAATWDTTTTTETAATTAGTTG